MITMYYFDNWISHDGICGYCVELDYKLRFMTRGLGHIYKRNSVEFLVNFRVLEYFRIVYPLDRVGILIFQTGCDIRMPYEFLAGVLENWIHSRIRDSCHVLNFGSGRDRKHIICIVCL